MVSRSEYDSIVTKRRKCTPRGGCKPRMEVAQGSPAPPVASGPEVSAFLHPNNRLPPSMFQNPINVGKYTQRLAELSNEIAGVQLDLSNYQTRIAGGSHAGLGHYIQQGNTIVAGLSSLHDRTSQQRTMHQHLSLQDLQLLYSHAVNHVKNVGGNHPASHPRNPGTYTSRTALVEALTDKTQYGFEPLDVLQYYHQLPPPAPAPLPPPPPTT